jgi:hypothetical protein
MEALPQRWGGKAVLETELPGLGRRTRDGLGLSGNRF